MAVAFDVKATADTTFNPPAATNTVTNMTPGASATALVVFCAIATPAANTTLSTVTGVTWNGVSMSLIASKLQVNGVAACYAFGLASPATGNHNIVVSVSGGTIADNAMYVDAVSFTGTALTTALAFPSANVLTDASTPTGTAYPTTAFSVTTANGDAVAAVMNCFLNQFDTTTGTLIRMMGQFKETIPQPIGSPPLRPLRFNSPAVPAVSRLAVLLSDCAARCRHHHSYISDI